MDLAELACGEIDLGECILARELGADIKEVAENVA